MAKARKKYSKEFKIEAVRQVIDRGRPVRAVARSLGISETLLHSWKRRLIENGELAFPGNGNRQTTSELEAENRRLRKELAEAKADQEILKKAAAYFAKHQD